MDLLGLFLATLATYRAAHMLATEEGPFGLFTKLRYYTGQRNWIGRGLHCVYCLSFWIAGLFGAYLSISNWYAFPLYWFGIAGGVLVLHKVLSYTANDRTDELIALHVQHELLKADVKHKAFQVIKAQNTSVSQ